MTYTVKGYINKRIATVTWQDGKLDGDITAVRMVELQAELLEGRMVGPVGIYTTQDHLSSDLSALMIIADVMDGVISVTGNVPTAPLPPEGAV